MEFAVDARSCTHENFPLHLYKYEKCSGTQAPIYSPFLHCIYVNIKFAVDCSPSRVIIYTWEVLSVAYIENVSVRFWGYDIAIHFLRRLIGKKLPPFFVAPNAVK